LVELARGLLPLLGPPGTVQGDPGTRGRGPPIRRATPLRRRGPREAGGRAGGGSAEDGPTRRARLALRRGAGPGVRAGPRTAPAVHLVRERAARRLRGARLGHTAPVLGDRGPPGDRARRPLRSDDRSDRGRDRGGNRAIRGRGTAAEPA